MSKETPQGSAIWPNKNGKGFLLVVQPGISISGRVVIIERKEKEKPASNTGAAAGDWP